MAPNDTLALSELTRAYLDTALRSDDGTLLPPTVTPNTADRQLLNQLPLVEGYGRPGALNLGATLGEGGMGIVRIAEQPAVGRQVAVKTLRDDRKGHDLVLHLLREAWITGGLEHPNIIPVHDVGLDADGRPMIVMKRVEGTVWSELIKDGSHDLRWHLKILEQVCHAVEFAGARGIIHRDLKPANVMIGKFAEVYVLDWGIAVSLDEDPSGRLPLARDVAGIAGTPGYMAPEMVADTGQDLSLATDVYLLGAVLHELITKERRHLGDSLQAVLLSSMRSDPFDYPDYLPDELAEIARRATRPEPEARYAHAAAFRRALSDFLEHESSRELTEDAHLRMNRWAELERGEEPANPVAVQDLFSEARFGFEQALRAWPDNAEARAGLQACLERKFEHDLLRDDFEAASVVLAALAEHRPDLQARLTELERRLESRRSELTKLRQLQRARDLNVGRRTRAFLMLITALSFAGIAGAGAWVPSALSIDPYDYFYATGALKLFSALLLVTWARDSLSKTQVNRQLTAVLFLLIVMELAVRPFAQTLGHPVEHSLLIDFGIYALVTATLAITVDKRLAWSPVFYSLAVAAALKHIEGVYYFLALAHLGSFFVMAVAWRPKTLLPTPDERAEVRRRSR